MSSENTRRIAKNTAMLYIRMLLIMAVTLYTSRVVLNVLGVEDFGIYNVVGGIVVMFSFLNGTMASATQRFLSFAIGKNDFLQLKKVFSLTLTLHIGIAFFILVLTETIGLWFLNTQMNIPDDRMEAARWIYQFSLFSFMVSVVQVPYNATIIAHERMNVYAYISIVETGLKLLIVFLLTWMDYDKLKLYAVLVFGVTVVVALLYRIYCKNKFDECHYYFVWDKSLFHTLTDYAGWNLSGHIALIARTQGVNILLNIFFGPVLNAARGVAVQVNTAVLSFVTNFQLAANPQIVKLYAGERLGEMKRLILRSSKFSFLLLYFLALPVILETEFVLKIWLKTVPDYGVLFCRLILITTLVDVLSGMLGYGALATGKVKAYWIVLSSLFLVDLPLVYMAFRLGYSPEIIFYIEIVLYVIALFVRLAFLKQMIGFSFQMYLWEVVGRSLLVVSISLGISCFGLIFFFEGWMRFLFTCVLSFLVVGGVGYWIGLDKEEKSWIRIQFFNCLKKLGIYDEK